MPIYEYICTNCNEIFSLLLWSSAPKRDITCPKCGSKDVQKKLSSFSCSCSVNPGNSSGGSSSGFGGGG
ncbi:MAG: zinc ribbon domain-containing protein [Nitrospirae bacterium]|nr:zinc ribbon domain-containing protein [Nitrospirota bacterium]